MRYMLDTNICIYLIKKKPDYLIRRLKTFEVSDIVISSMTLSELEYGIEKSQNSAQNRMALDGFVAPFDIVHYDNRAAMHYGKIRANLEKKGKIIGPLDLCIAAHALSLDLVLVTNNVREFSRVEGLKILNWIKSR